MPRTFTFTPTDQDQIFAITVIRDELTVVNVSDGNTKLQLSISTTRGGSPIIQIPSTGGKFDLRPSLLESLDEGMTYQHNIWDYSNSVDGKRIATGTFTHAESIKSVDIAYPTVTLADGTLRIFVTQAQYDAINPKLPNAEYVISDAATTPGEGKAPTAANALTDQSYTQDTGNKTINAAPDFQNATGGAWSVSGAGATISDTGVVTIPTGSLRSAVTVTVTYTKAGAPPASSAFSVTVVAVFAAVSISIAGLTNNPTYGATAQDGTTLSALVEAPQGAVITYQWREGDVEIDGATNQTFTVNAGVNIVDLARLELAVFINGNEYKTSATVRMAPPTALGQIADQTYTRGEGLKVVASGPDFAGRNLTFTSNAGNINPSTGAVSMSTLSVGATNVVVAATNSGGTVTSGFTFTVNEIVITPITTVYTRKTLDGEDKTLLPATFTVAPQSGATSAVVVIQTTSDIVLTAKMDGEEMTPVGSVSMARSSGRRMAHTFISKTKTSGALVVSSTTAYDNKAYVGVTHTFGGKPRSVRFESVSYEFPAGATADHTLSFSNRQFKNGDIVIFDAMGVRNNSAFSTAPSALVALGTHFQASGSLTGYLYKRTYAADTVETFSVTVGALNMDYFGLFLLVLSQEPVIQAVPNEPLADGFIEPLNLARTQSVVPVSGVYSGANTAIEARIVTSAGAQYVPWAVLDAAPSGGTFAGEITVPATAQALRVQTRYASNPSVVSTQTGTFHVGLWIVGYGQSNKGAETTSEEVIPYATGTMAYYAPTGQIGLSVTGDGVKKTVNSVLERTGFPCFYILNAAAGVSVQALTPTGNANTFVNFETAFNALGRRRVHGMFWHQGEGNILIPRSLEYYGGYLVEIQEGLAALVNQTANDIPILVSSLSSYGTWEQYGEEYNAKWTNMDDVHKSINDVIPNAYFSDSWRDAVRIDGYHSYGKSYGRRAKRTAHRFANILGIEAKSGILRIGSAARTSATVTTVNLAHSLGTDIEVVTLPHRSGSGEVLPGSFNDIDGFEVSSDNGVTWVACAGARASASSITLTHASIGTGARRLRYLFGADPLGDTGGLVRDNSYLKAVLLHESNFAVV